MPPASRLLGIIPHGGVRVLVGSAVFKTVEAGVPRLAGSIPVRLRYQPKWCGRSTNRERLSRPESPEFYRTSNDSDLEIPLSAPRARTRSSTSRVLTPCKYAPSPPRTTPGRPCAGVPAATGRKTQPAAWGSATPSHRSWSPAPGVGAVALPRPVRVRWCGAAPITAVSLASINLVDRLGGLADPLVDLRGLECIQDFQPCRLVKGHRALCPFAKTIGVGLADHRTVAANVVTHAVAARHLHHSWDGTDRSCWRPPGQRRHPVSGTSCEEVPVGQAVLPCDHLQTLAEGQLDLVTGAQLGAQRLGHRPASGWSA